MAQGARTVSKIKLTGELYGARFQSSQQIIAIDKWGVKYTPRARSFTSWKPARLTLTDVSAARERADFFSPVARYGLAVGWIRNPILSDVVKRVQESRCTKKRTRRLLYFLLTCDWMKLRRYTRVRFLARIKRRTPIVITVSRDASRFENNRLEITRPFREIGASRSREARQAVRAPLVPRRWRVQANREILAGER